MTDHRTRRGGFTPATMLIGFCGVAIPALAQEPPERVPIWHHHAGGPRQHTHHETASRLPVGITLSSAWDSRYVSEGRDNLDGDSLWGTTLELSARGFTLGAWYAEGQDNPYDEFNAWLEYALEAGDFELYLGYTHLEFMDDGAEDDEIGAGLAYNGFACGVVPAVDWYYSFEAGGSFIELSAAREFVVAPWLTLEPGLVLGLNEGYVADGHDGANHLAATLAAAVPLRDDLALGGYLSYNWAIDADAASHPDDALLDDFFFGGVSLTLSF